MVDEYLNLATKKEKTNRNKEKGEKLTEHPN